MTTSSGLDGAARRPVRVATAGGTVSDRLLERPVLEAERSLSRAAAGSPCAVRSMTIRAERRAPHSE
jgi:hypothetical protein